MLITTLGGVSLSPAHAATPTCTEAVRKFASSGDRMFIPVQYSTLSDHCVMRRGNKNNAVRYLQEVLRDVYDYNIAVDGDFGPATERALISQQRAFGIKADGIYGPQTRDSICWLIYDGGGTMGCWWYRD
jgi:peptidoglycan hydrolase-like protein with peptidoglycan-binding domain